MKIKVLYRSDPERPLKDPLPEKSGFVFRLIRGNLCSPLNGQWFGPKWPTIVLRANVWFPIPFLAWRLGNHGGYIGAKVYGVDREEYFNWMPVDDVYAGSEAFCISARLWADVSKEQ